MSTEKPLTRYTVVSVEEARIACSTEAGTQLLNLVARLGIPCRVLYNRDCYTVHRVIMPSLPAHVAFALAIDLERYNLTGVIYDYSNGKYTGGIVPSLAWYAALEGAQK